MSAAPGSPGRRSPRPGRGFPGCPIGTGCATISSPGEREPEFSTSVALLANGRAAVLLSRFDGPALQRLADPEGFDLNAANGFFANMAQGVVGMD